MKYKKIKKIKNKKDSQNQSKNILKKKIINKKDEILTYNEFPWTKDMKKMNYNDENNFNNDISDDDIIEKSLSFLKLNLAKKLFKFDYEPNKIQRFLF